MPLRGRPRAARPSPRVDRTRLPATTALDGWPSPPGPQGPGATEPGVQADSSATTALSRANTLLGAVVRPAGLPALTCGFPGVPVWMWTGCARGCVCVCRVRQALDASADDVVSHGRRSMWDMGLISVWGSTGRQSTTSAVEVSARKQWRTWPQVRVPGRSRRQGLAGRSTPSVTRGVMCSGLLIGYLHSCSGGRPDEFTQLDAGIGVGGIDDRANHAAGQKDFVRVEDQPPYVRV